MKKIKNVSSGYGTQKSSLPNSSNVNVKDKFSMVLGDRKREAENILKMKKDENNQLSAQLQSLNEKTADLISKRNKLLVNINQQKSQIFLLKNKNKAYRNYLNELTAKDSSELEKNKKGEEDFNSISKLSENISDNICQINEILSVNCDKMKIGQDDLLKNIPVEFLKNLCAKIIVNK